MIRIKSDRIIAFDRFFDGYVYIENGVIADVTAEERQADQCFDFTGRYVSPGFIETHTHGGGGFSFFRTCAEDVARACDFHLKHGATSVCPTLVACSYGDMLSSMESIRTVIDGGLSGANVLGAHIEGPYLSVSQCGGQPTGYITAPVKREYEDVVERYGKYITRWTYAPERDTEGEFCRFITKRGILASAGHSDALYSDMCRAIEDGCNLITHLYSCTSTVTRDHGFRRLGVIESAFLRDELYVELICDGKHLPPELIKMIVKIKGSDKVILTTDSLEVAGSEKTSGRYSDTEYIIEDGVAKLPDRSAFAGSVATANTLIRTLTADCSLGIPESVKMLTRIPASLLGVNKGDIAVGKDADIVVFDDDINVTDVFVMGKKAV